MLVASDLELGASDVELGATNLDLPVDWSTFPKIHLLYSIVFARFPLLVSQGGEYQRPRAGGAEAPSGGTGGPERGGRRPRGGGKCPSSNILLGEASIHSSQTLLDSGDTLPGCPRNT